MRIVKGMDLEVMLSDVAAIMDMPFNDQASYQHQQLQQMPQPLQEQQQQQQLVPSANEHWSEDSESSDPGDVFAWPSDLKLALSSPRKRKLWDAAAGDGGQQGMAEGKRARERSMRRFDGGCRMGSWQVEDLAGDLDQSLAGLSVDVRRVYELDTLLALPSLTVFKQEAPSPANNDQGLVSGGVGEADSSATNAASQLHQLLQQDTNGVVGSTTGQNEASSSPAVSSTGSSSSHTDLTIDCRFQYVLAAATSIATKVNEETLTYLNQGQSYEIKLKKLGELSAYRGKILKSCIRICFHERRLQYMEREQIAAWQASRPGDRIVEVDVPLSYGLLDVVQDPLLLNTVEFLWDPTKEVGVYIKVNCISTEFTPKKHGGEKGVPFRIQVETFLQGEGTPKRLHAAACQIKVFKLKGGDRKHKQDREKILKRPLCEQDKFQPSYECTVLNDVSVDAVFSSPMNAAVSSSGTFPPSDTQNAPGQQSSASQAAMPKEERGQHLPAVVAPTPPTSIAVPDQTPVQEMPIYLQPLCSDASAQQTAQWLQAQRFSAHLRTFASFSGADLLRLSRDDLIQICGLPDGIRLFNALHSKSIAPRLTVYLSLEAGSVYHALFLERLSFAELSSKLCTLLGLESNQLQRVFLLGPNGAHVLVSDEVVRNLPDQALFSIQLLHDQASEQYRLLLKPAST